MRTKREWRQASKENYEVFCKRYPQINITFKTWSNIIYQYNYNFRDYILETGLKAKLPWGVGEFAVKKNKLKKFVQFDGIEKIKLPAC